MVKNSEAETAQHYDGTPSDFKEWIRSGYLRLTDAAEGPRPSQGVLKMLVDFYPGAAALPELERQKLAEDTAPLYDQQ